MTGQELYDRLGAMTEEERARRCLVYDDVYGRIGITEVELTGVVESDGLVQESDAPYAEKVIFLS